MNWVKKYWKNRPLLMIFWVAFLLRIISAVFSQGYLFYSEHFNSTEVAYSWILGDDTDRLLPWNQDIPEPKGKSLLFSGIEYVLLLLPVKLSISDPKVLILINRIILAFFSLLVVYYSYMITKRISNEKNAKQVGLLLATLWFMPFLSVRNLPELICLPFILAGISKFVSSVYKKELALEYLISGFVIGTGLSIFFESFIFVLIFTIVVIVRHKWQATYYYLTGLILSLITFMGVVDYIIWKKPFAEFTAFFANSLIQINYHQFWFYYLLFLIAVFLLPIGLFFIIGFIKTWKDFPLLFFPSLIFIIFHNVVVNEIKTLILFIIPFYIILAIIGWNKYVDQKEYLSKRKNILKWVYVSNWIMNLLVLPFVIVAFPNKPQVEAMSHLSEKNNQINSIILNNNELKDKYYCPVFYSGRLLKQYILVDNTNADISLKDSYTEINKYQYQINLIEFFSDYSYEELPDYLLIYGNTEDMYKVGKFKNIFPFLDFEQKFERSMFDRFLNSFGFGTKDIYLYKIKIE